MGLQIHLSARGSFCPKASIKKSHGELAPVVGIQEVVLADRFSLVL